MTDENSNKSFRDHYLVQHALKVAVGAIVLGLPVWIAGYYLEFWNAIYCLSPTSDALKCGR